MTVFAVDRSPHGLVVVSGPDGTSFLQSLISQDLDAVPDGASAPSLLLTPQGKLDVLFRISHVGDEWWLDTDAEFGQRLAESLNRFKIRVKADVEDRTSSSGLLTIVGTPAQPENAIAIPTRWGDLPGIDVLGDAADVAHELASLQAEVARWDRERFEAFRIEQGVPKLGIDIDDKTIPQEAFLEDAVSFTKGCYLGQELVARIDSRGHVNRYLRRLQVDGDAVPPYGAEVIAGDKSVGTITSAATVPTESRVIALGMVRREVEPPADVTVRWAGHETQAQVLASITFE
ncbi:MAG: folate-binding protein YgfZ [Actinobacteria bacterium]|nr:folate-binding protein YgfZ [Actinomycetota bacterium]